MGRNPIPKKTLSLVCALAVGLTLSLSACQKDEGEKPTPPKSTATLDPGSSSADATPTSPSGSGSDTVTPTPPATDSPAPSPTDATSPPSSESSDPASEFADQHLGAGSQEPDAQPANPVIRSFGAAYANTSGTREQWLKGLKPLVTPDLYEAFTYTDYSLVQRGSTVVSAGAIGGMQDGSYPFRIEFSGENAQNLEGFTQQQSDGSVKIDKVYPDGTINAKG